MVILNEQIYISAVEVLNRSRAEGRYTYVCEWGCFAYAAHSTSIPSNEQPSLDLTVLSYQLSS